MSLFPGLAVLKNTKIANGGLSLIFFLVGKFEFNLDEYILSRV